VTDYTIVTSKRQAKIKHRKIFQRILKINVITPSCNWFTY